MVRSAGSFRTKVAARDAAKGAGVCVYIPVPLTSPAARGGGESRERGVVSRWWTFFSFFSLFLRESFLKGFIIIAKRPIMLTTDKLFLNPKNQLL